MNFYDIYCLYLKFVNYFVFETFNKTSYIIYCVTEDGLNNNYF